MRDATFSLPEAQPLNNEVFINPMFTGQLCYVGIWP